MADPVPYSAENERSKKLAQDKLRRIGFDPGKAGFALKLGTGKTTPASDQLCVTKITHEGQAYWRGVKKGWVIKLVNGNGIEKDSRTLTFSATITKMLKERAQSGKKYNVTFILPAKDARARARRSMTGMGSRMRKTLQEESAALEAADNFTFEDEQKEPVEAEAESGA